MELTPDDIRALRDWKAWLRTNGQRATRTEYVTLQPPRMFTNAKSLKLVKAPSGGIPGRVGTLLGKASCDVWDESSTTNQIKDSTKNIDVYNWTTSAACKNGDRFGIAGWCNGAWYIIAEDCNDKGSTLSGGSGTSSGGTISPALDTGTTSPATSQSSFTETRYAGTVISGGSGFE